MLIPFRDQFSLFNKDEDFYQVDLSTCLARWLFLRHLIKKWLITLMERTLRKSEIFSSFP